ncbi:MAG TPA: magnesium/cobalt efflux protein, partial [Legionellales bacterium]|nr:magnesium/cobalt efflux protein [Legionellales bacterium]
DITNLSKDIVAEKNDAFIIDASITLRQLKRLLHWQLPELGPRTLSGIIIEYLGYIPPASCCLKLSQYQIEILKVSDNMIKTVRVRKIK